MDAERVVPGNDHRVRGIAPGGSLLEIGAEQRRVARVKCDGVRSRAEVSLRDEVRVHVVVRDGAVLVGPGDPVDPEAAERVVVAECAPEARGLDKELEADLVRERLVSGCCLVADDGVGDVARDVERRGAGGPVAGALVTPDRAPGKSRAGEPELVRPFAREVERRVPPTQRVAGCVRNGVREHRQDEPLGVPERVPVIARPREPFRRDRALLGARTRLQRVEEREPHRLLQLGVAVELDIGMRPEVVQIRALVGNEALPARVARLGERGDDLVAQRGVRAPARPAVREELHEPEALAGYEIRRDCHPADVGAAFRGRVGSFGALDDVIHAGRHGETARARRVDEDDARGVVEELLRDER